MNSKFRNFVIINKFHFINFIYKKITVQTTMKMFSWIKTVTKQKPAKVILNLVGMWEKITDWNFYNLNFSQAQETEYACICSLPLQNKNAKNWNWKDQNVKCRWILSPQQNRHRNEACLLHAKAMQLQWSAL